MRRNTGSLRALTQHPWGRRDTEFRIPKAKAHNAVTATEYARARLNWALEAMFLPPLTRLALHHGPNQLMVDEPGRRIANPQVALEGQHRQPVLGLTESVSSPATSPSAT